MEKNPDFNFSFEKKMVFPYLDLDYLDETELTFERWMQRLDVSFRVFQVKDNDMKKYYLLHFIGPENYNLVSDSLIPAKLSDPEVSYDTITTFLENHFNPTQPLEIAEIFKFHQRVQMEEECIRDYVRALQMLAVNCNFGVYFKTALRNQFVCGIRNKVMQDILLGIKDLKFDEAVATALSMEAVKKKKSLEIDYMEIEDTKCNPFGKKKSINRILKRSTLTCCPF